MFLMPGDAVLFGTKNNKIHSFLSSLFDAYPGAHREKRTSRIQRLCEENLSVESQLCTNVSGLQPQPNVYSTER
jgi:hypothetical protein